ncbi:MAG: hypothetical protein PHP98_06095 [Kiritimatiellae bacterium]|nr:hypothetical protein [Kiritimatiellia bacterium]
MNPEEKKVLQETNLRHLVRAGAFRFIDRETPWFPYTSGQVGAYYLQSVCIESDGRAYAHAARSLAELIRSEAGAFDVISGGESRDWDFSNPAAVLLEKPHAKIYKDGRLIGAALGGKKVVHVADLNNEGSSVRDCWKPAIEKAGGALAGVFSFVDRLEDGHDLFLEMGLPSFNVVPLDKNAWDIILQENVISGSLHDQLVARMQDRRKWAINALLNNPEYFRKFYSENSTRDKALKIMRTYVEISGKLKAII